MNERILTLHPAGKSGVRIDRAKYDAVRAATAAVTAAHTTLLADARAFHTAHNAALVASGAEKIGVTGAPGM